MDPAGIVGLVGVAAQILKTIHHYTEGVSDYGDEVASLRVELFCLKSALTQIDGNSLSTPADEFHRMTEEARLLLQTLADILQVEASRAKELARRLTWPLKKQHVRDLTARLERTKTYFIFVATKDTLDAAKVAASTLDMLYRSVEDLKATAEDKSREAAISSWLTSFDPHAAHTAALSSRYENTNAWFLDGVLTDWFHSDKGGCLWLRGKPGSGKTCIAAACISRLRQLNREPPVVFFYCSNNNAESQQPRTVLAWFVKQLYRHDPNMRLLVQKAYAEDWEAQGGVPDSKASLSVLKLLAAAICSNAGGQLIFVIDAIDECGESPRALLELLFELMSSHTRLRLVLTSTESVADVIDSASMTFGVHPTSVELQTAIVKGDIDAYIEKRLSEEGVLSKLRPQLRIDIRETLQQEHNGSFRWAQCTIDDLATLTTPKAIKQALKGITPSLSNIYMSVLHGIPGHVAHEARSMLVCLFTALRQLTLGEVAEAAVFNSNEEFDEDDRIIEPLAIIRHLRSLVRYDPFTQKVELAHSSVRVFLATPRKSGAFHIDAASANKRMCRLCLGYLLLPSFSEVCADISGLAKRKKDWPFLEYATYWWAHHVRAAGDSLPENIKDLASAFFDSANRESGGNFAAWYQCAYPRRGSRTWTTKPLYICAREGLVDILKTLLSRIRKDELEEKGGSRGSTALHVASAFGETEAVKLLIAAGADVHERNRDGENGLQWAWFWGHSDTVEVLLQAGADASLLEGQTTGSVHQCNSRSSHLQRRDDDVLMDIPIGGAETVSTPSRAHKIPETPLIGHDVQPGAMNSVSSYASTYVSGQSARLHEVPLKERRRFLGGTSLSQEERLRKEIASRDFKIPPRATLSATSVSDSPDRPVPVPHSVPDYSGLWDETTAMVTEEDECCDPPLPAKARRY